MRETNIERLTRIMEREKAFLIDGFYDELEATNQEKDNLLERLDERQASAEELTRLAQLVQEVEALSAVALEGFRTARTAFEAREAARSRLSSYQADGSAHMIEARIEEKIRRA